MGGLGQRRTSTATGSWPSRAGEVVGWAALAPVSERCCYAGVAEDSVYVADEAQGRGVGRALLEAADRARRADGFWTLQAGVFPENEASLGLQLRKRAASASSAVRERLGQPARRLARRRPPGTTKRGDHMTKVEAVVVRERVETVIDAVEEQTGHVGVTVVEAIGHGRQRGITHEYRGRIFESRFLPKAC